MREGLSKVVHLHRQGLCGSCIARAPFSCAEHSSCCLSAAGFAQQGISGNDAVMQQLLHACIPRASLHAHSAGQGIP